MHGQPHVNTHQGGPPLGKIIISIKRRWASLVCQSVSSRNKSQLTLYQNTK